MLLSDKFCSRCNTTKPLSDFGPNRSRKDGLQAYCRTCYKQYMQNHYLANVSKRKAYRKAQYWSDPSKAREDASRWYYENIERARKTRNLYYDKNAKRVIERARAHEVQQRKRDLERFKRMKAAHSARRRARQRENCIAPVNYEDVLRRDGTFCYLCQQPITDGSIHIDHVIPIAADGSHTLQNLRVTHGVCNDSKGTKTPWEWWDRKNLPYPPKWSIVGLIPPD